MKNILLTVGVAVALILGVVSYTKDVEAPAPVIQNVGAVSSPDISSRYLSWGSLQTYRSRVALATATNTPCSIQSPAATSSLSFASLNLTTGTSTATVWTLAKAATAFATTTPFNTYSVGSGALASITQYGTSSINGNDVIGPNTYLVWGVQGTVIADATKLLGTCTAEFMVL